MSVQHYPDRNAMVKELVPIGGVIAELGVFQGEFAKVLYDTLKPSKMYLVDTWNGRLISGDVDGNNVVAVDAHVAYEKTKTAFQLEREVMVVRKTTTEFLHNLEDNSLNLVYIDADHSYEGVKQDLYNSWSKVQAGGWIMGHDYEINSNKCRNNYDFGVKRAVDEFVKHYGLRIEALALDGCVSFAIKKPM